MPESISGYRDLTRIGHGGFSVVYRAHQEAFDRTVALKVLRMSSDDEVRRRFLREVKLTGRLTGHPNVVTILDAGTTESGQPYLATELYEAGSLKDRLRESGPLPAAEVAEIGAKIADALSAAHELGVVHRDVKPGNILVSRFGEPALADFGVGCLLDAATSSAVLDSFSPYHAAPEVISRSSPSPASDVYSLGSTMYELLSGRPAFGGEGAEIAAVLWQIVHEPAPALQCPELPGLAEVIGRALSKDPDKRQTSAAAFSLALRALPRPEPGPVARAPVPEAARKVYVSAFKPVSAAATPQESGDTPQPATVHRRRWQLFAGAAFAVTVVISVVTALVWSPPSPDTTTAPSSPGRPATPLGSAVSAAGGTSPRASALSSMGLAGALPFPSKPSAGSGAPGATGSPGRTAGPTTSAVVAPSTSPAASSTAATKSCSGWSYTDNSNGSATVIGNDRVRSGPYAACSNVAVLAKGAQVNLWCYVLNTNAVAWVYVQVPGSLAAGWVPEQRLAGVTGTLNHC
jgi:serine/threonine protein kinase